MEARREPALPGLPPAAPRWRQGFAWSVSRHHLWERCRRAFFYDVIAPLLPRPPVPWHELERLRSLTSFRVVKGQAVHGALEAGIAAARDGQEPLKAAKAELDRELRSYALHPERTLAEVVNGRPFEARALEHARAEGQQMVERFFAQLWPRYAARRYLQHEGFGRFEAAGLRVNLKPDLVTAGPEGLLISDWKTGRDWGGEDESLQLSTYVLWATRALGEPLERVRAELVFLADGSVKATQRTAAQLAQAEERIAASARAMLALQRFEDAPPSPGPHCVECKFAGICPEGRARLA